MDAETGEPVTVWNENTGITIEDFSPNGELMVFFMFILFCDKFREGSKIAECEAAVNHMMM